jgi:hypothetical protein
MKLATFGYVDGAWSRRFPDLDSERTLVLVFAASLYGAQPRVLIELAAAYPRAVMIGCSTAGEIDQTQIRDESIAVAVVQFERTRLRRVEAPVDATPEAFAVGQQIAAELASPELRAVLVLSPGTRVNAQALVDGLNAALPPHVLVTGGLAGDGDRFGPTWVVSGGRIATDKAVAVGLYGDRVRVSHGTRGGWETFGVEGAVTRSCANVVYEIDERPALAVYKEQVGDRAGTLPHDAPAAFPLLLRSTTGRGAVRGVIGIDEAAQSLTLAVEVPRGSFVRPMHADRDRLVREARAAGVAAAIRSEGPVLCVAISCLGRRTSLGERSEQETSATLEGLPAGTAQVGFYAYGEIAPHAAGGCDLHNHTMTLTVLSEVA